MGLSMYICGIGEDYDWDKNILYMMFIEEMYWCKDYIMHEWFVKNVQNGINDGRVYFMKKEKMKEFIEYCKSEIENFKVDDDDGKHHLYCCEYAIEQWEQIKNKYITFSYRGW